MSANGKSSPKDAALIALKRAEQEATTEGGNLLVVGALIVTAIRAVEMLEVLKKPRAKVKATPPTKESTNT